MLTSPPVLLAMMQLFMVESPNPPFHDKLRIPPPSLAELPDRVLLLTVNVPLFSMQPPTLAELPDRVQLLTVNVVPPRNSMPPPPNKVDDVEVTVLPDRVLLLTVSTCHASMPPPPTLAELPDRVLWLTVSVRRPSGRARPIPFR